MVLKSLLFLQVLVYLISDSQTLDTKKVVPLKILQKFLDLVEDHNLNVSIVTSRAKYWTNGNVQDRRDNSLLLPPNKVYLTESKLDLVAGNQWLQDLESWTSQGKGIATYRRISILDGEITRKVSRSSDIEQIPLSPSYESILAPENSIFDGLVNESVPYHIQYDFEIPKDGQNELLSLYAFNVNVTSVRASENMPQSEIDQIQQVILKVWFTADTMSLRTEYVSKYLNTEIPLDGFQWNVLVTDSLFIGDGLDSKWALFQIADDFIYVYALIP